MVSGFEVFSNFALSPSEFVIRTAQFMPIHQEVGFSDSSVFPWLGLVEMRQAA
jgi:hypothetical protein